MKTIEAELAPKVRRLLLRFIRKHPGCNPTDIDLACGKNPLEAVSRLSP